MLLFLLAGFFIGGTVVGLSVGLPDKCERCEKDHVLMLSTKELSNVPMVIGFDGESVLQLNGSIFYIDIFLLSL